MSHCQLVGGHVWPIFVFPAGRQELIPVRPRFGDCLAGHIWTIDESLDKVMGLEAGEAAWLARLAAGGSLETATGSALAVEPGFDLNACLQRHLQRTTLVDAMPPGPGDGDHTTPH